MFIKVCMYVRRDFEISLPQRKVKVVDNKKGFNFPPG